MSNFEFSQNLNFGQYLPTNSSIHNLDARARILIFTMLMIAIMFAQSPIMVISGLVLMLILFRLAKVPLKFSWKAIRTPLPFLLFLAIFQLFRFAPGINNPLLLSISSLSLTISGVIAAFMLILRFSALIMVISLASFTLSTSDIIYGMQSLLRPLNWLHIPSEDVVMILQITIRFLPMLGQATEQITKAQAARGAAWGLKEKNPLRRIKLIIPVIIPMFLTSLQRAETMALAMDARGYGNHIQRGSYQQFVFQLKDGYALAAVLLLALIILFL
jgi:energy-coupling factor transport system permease protein